MEYEMSDALPMKNSFCCDKWGYYNGYDSSKEVFPFVPFVARKVTIITKENGEQRMGNNIVIFIQ